MSKTKARTPDGTKRAPSMRAAASVIRVPIEWIVRAKDAGVDAFTANGSVIIEPVREWINAHIPELEASKEELTRKEQKLVEEIRNLRLKNDQREGSLVLKSWVAERFYRGAGEVNNVRVQLEALYPVKLAEAAGDIPKLRVIFRQGIDELMTAFLSCGKHFR